jgi:AraC-like DNA-binding protein
MMKYQHVFHYDCVDALNSAPHGWDVDIRALRSGPEHTRLSGSASDNVLINVVKMDCGTLQKGSAPGALGKLPEAMTFSDRERGKLFTRLVAFGELLVSGFQSSQAPMRVQQQEEELITSFLADITGVSQTGQKAPFDKRYRATRSALDYIHNHPREAITVAALASATGASRRTLETGFRDMLDMSPKQFINTSRLRGCREELALQRGEPGGRIVDTAHSWGFFHLGQFAADYRKLFGELPSQTLM